jgi:two-component system OmpR family response regulator/two-component system alkaline phosphatase synthesis response regulator PhoP
MSGGATMNTSILIVDDEKDLRDVLKDRFEQELFEVLVASDGSEAVEIVDKKRPSIIIMDVMMPVLNGIEAKKIIRKKGYNIPIIFITIKPKDEIIDEMDENTFYMEKPINVKELRTIIIRQIASSPPH